MKYDVQSFLKIYMPDFYSLVEVQNVSWNSINRIFFDFVQKIKDEYEHTGKVVSRDATFYSIVMGQIKMDGKGDGMFDFYNCLFHSLSNQLSQNQKKMISKTLYNILVEVDKNYLNFIGELAVLNEFLKERKYELKNIEEPIKVRQGKQADFLFWDNEAEEYLLIEVVNIHFEDKELKDEEYVSTHIKRKVIEKMDDKFKAVDRPFCLQPVIWTKDFNSIVCLKQLYQKQKISIENVSSPYVYYSFLAKPLMSFEHHFERLLTL